jgi:hypothetical protein
MATGVHGQAVITRMVAMFAASLDFLQPSVADLDNVRIRFDTLSLQRHAEVRLIS